MTQIKSGISRRDYLTLSAGGLLLPAYTGLGAAASQKRPNILFLNVDQLSIFAVSCYGATEVKTPNIDRLARRGILFRKSYSANPVCCPARSSWATGRMSSEHGVMVNSSPIRKDLPDWGRWFAQAGYETVHVGKWHIPGRKPQDSFTVIHDSFPCGEFSDSMVAQSCRAFLSERKPGRPFFLEIGLMNPHDICGTQQAVPETPLFQGFEAGLTALPGNWNTVGPEPEAFVESIRNAGDQAATRSWNEFQWKYYRWVYHRMVEWVDCQIGYILDALDASGYTQDTLVVFTADHGEGAGRHGLILKQTLYEEAVRVPLIFSMPGLSEGTVNDSALVSGVDLFPTFCDFAGIAPPKVAGLSIRPVLEGRKAKVRDILYAESGSEGRMVRDDRFKYITYHGSKTEQLFDLEKDPLETENLAARTGYESMLRQKAEQLAQIEGSLEKAPQIKKKKHG